MVAKAKVASGSPREKCTLGAVFAFAAEGQLPVFQMLVLWALTPPELGPAEAAWGWALQV